MKNPILLGLALPLTAILAAAQSPIVGVTSRPEAKPAAVTYLFPEQVTVAAEKPSPVDLHFKVAEGLHVNSHTPSAEELIPTTLKFPETGDVHLAKADFPPGADFTLSIGSDTPAEKLSVYTGEFIIHAELIAAKGEHLVQASLRYQACSSNTCLPPRTIPVAIDVIAK
jgi:Disulphide bond corrector protein DsbC